jgi:20S proteasome subunit beta 5
MFNFNDDFLDDLDFGLPDSFKPESSSLYEEIVKDLPSETTSTEFIFKLANVEDNEKYVQKLKDDKMTKKLTDFKKGTTTLGFVYKEGILIAVDSRASMGSFIGSQKVRKVIEINDYLLGTMAGGAADCMYWERRLAMWCKLYELRNGERVPVSAASQYLANMITQYRGYGLSMGTMVAGWDKREQGLYYVDDDGTRLKGYLFSVGSGSTYAYGILDSKYRYDMTREEAITLGREAIYHATHRDAGSGGVVRVYNIVKGGWEKIIDGEDVNEIHYAFAHAKKLRGDQNETDQELFNV